MKNVIHLVGAGLLSLSALSCQKGANEKISENNSGSRVTTKPANLKVHMKSVKVDAAAKTATFPLYAGWSRGVGRTYYIITEASDYNTAKRLGINFAPALKNAIGSKGAQKVWYEGKNVMFFPGFVNFRPRRSVTPNPTTGFPPAAFTPGSMGSANHSPLVVLPNNVVLNIGQVANRTGVHDRVVKIDYAKKEVTIQLVDGFYEGEAVLYITTDASADMPAALEAVTFAPALGEVPTLGIGALNSTSARKGLAIVVNGAKGAANGQRQGLESALSGDGAPLNVLQEEPENDVIVNNPYSPLWDAHLTVWTNKAISEGKRRRIIDVEEMKMLKDGGYIESFGGSGGPANPEMGGIKATGFIVNCPVVGTFVKE
jgi:hypothetical protein